MSDNLSLRTVGVDDEHLDQQIATFTQWEEFISAGSEARIYKDKAQWLLGKLALGVEKKYGESTLDKYAKEIKVPVNSLRVYRWVVAQYHDYFPPPTISFGILQTLASLPANVREELLTKAETEGMSVEAVRREVKGGKKQPEQPRVRIEYCSIHDKWQLYLDDPTKWEPIHEL